MVITSFGPSFHEQVELSLVFSINEKRPFPAVALTASAPGGGMQGRNKQGEVGAAPHLPLCLILLGLLLRKHQAQPQSWH